VFDPRGKDKHVPSLETVIDGAYAKENAPRQNLDGDRAIRSVCSHEPARPQRHERHPKRSILYERACRTVVGSESKLALHVAPLVGKPDDQCISMQRPVK
jgi:hypothetical protein